MTVSTSLWLQVRARANFACEYCGVTEADTGGELTVDHFRPQAHCGADSLDNLIYCCFRCNLNKGDYWPTQASDSMLWNPRLEPAEVHFLLLTDGVLHPITTKGAFTVNSVRLNRPSLVASRLRRLSFQKEARLLLEFRDLLASLKQMQSQHESLQQQYKSLLDMHHILLELLLQKLG